MSQDLTATTVRYLFASTWAPPSKGLSIKVPGAEVDGPDTADDLLNLAIWSLREQGLIEVEQLRPYKVEQAGGLLGGKSFARIRPLPGEALRLGGLEGALLTKAREKPEEGALGSLDDKLADLVSVDDDLGARRLVLQLGIGGSAPWKAVAGFCFREAAAAGLVGEKGRLFKKLVIVDPAGVEALKKRDAEIVAARKRYREEQEELDHAVMADSIQALHWAHHTGSDL